MSDYKTIPLYKVSILQAGIGFPIDIQGKSTGKYPFVKVGDISRRGRSGHSTLSSADHYVDEEDLQRLRTKPVPEGSILFAKIGEAIRHNHRVITDCEILIDNNAMAAIPRPGTLGRYLYHYLRTVDFYPLTSSTTVPALRKSELANIDVPLPSLSEQRSIATVLDKADELRSIRRRVVSQLDELTQSIFRDMFGDPMTNSMGWPRTTLTEVLSMPLRNGVSPSRGGRFQAKVLTLSAITGNEFKASALKLGDFEAAPPPTKIVDDSDLLICRGNGNIDLVGRAHYPKTKLPDVLFPDTVIAARTSASRVSQIFMEIVWKSKAVRRQIEVLARTPMGRLR